MPRIADDDWELPNYSVEEYAEKSSEYCITFPVFNEGERISIQLERLKPVCGNVDIIICDGDSTDGCTEAKKMKKHGVRAVIRKNGAGRMCAKIRLSLAYALRQGYEGIMTADGNNKDGVEAVPQYIAAFEAGCDVVLGSRYLPGGRSENTPLLRSLGIRLLHAPLMSLFARRRLTDTTNPFRMYCRDYLLDSRLKPFRKIFDSYNLHYYLAFQAVKLGYRVEEIAVERSYPPDAPPPTHITGIKEHGRIVLELLKTVTGGYDPPRRHAPAAPPTAGGIGSG
jgi:dolichol-phosphate mannosyltransferase